MPDNWKLGSLSSIGNIARSRVIMLVLALGVVGASLLTVHKLQSSSSRTEQAPEILEPITTVTMFVKL